MRIRNLLFVMAFVMARAVAADVPAPVPNASTAPGAKFQECYGCPEMIVIPPGSFAMGSPSSRRLTLLKRL